MDIFILELMNIGIYNACKLGKTINIPNRDQTYVTNEIKRGIFIIVIELDLIILDNIEKELQKYFNELDLNLQGCKLNF